MRTDRAVSQWQPDVSQWHGEARCGFTLNTRRWGLTPPRKSPLVDACRIHSRRYKTAWRLSLYRELTALFDLNQDRNHKMSSFLKWLTMMCISVAVLPHIGFTFFTWNYSNLPVEFTKITSVWFSWRHSWIKSKRRCCLSKKMSLKPSQMHLN